MFTFSYEIFLVDLGEPSREKNRAYYVVLDTYYFYGVVGWDSYKSLFAKVKLVVA